MFFPDLAGMNSVNVLELLHVVGCQYSQDIFGAVVAAVLGAPAAIVGKDREA